MRLFHRRNLFIATGLVLALPVIGWAIVGANDSEPARFSEWPAFTMRYEINGAPHIVGESTVTPLEMRSLVWNSPNDWRVTTISATPVATAYGTFSAAGSYKQQRGQIVTTFDAIDGSLEVIHLDEPWQYHVPDGPLSPFLTGAMALDGSGGATVATEARACRNSLCQGAQGLRFTTPDGSSIVVTADEWRIPLEAGDFKALQLTIRD